MSREIAIIGSTGRNAAAWAEAFLHAGFRVRSLVRSAPAHPRGDVRYEDFDLDDRSTYVRSLKRADLFALVTPADPRQTERELALIDAAKVAGVGRILNLSVVGADLPSPISAFARWQAPIESALRTSGVRHVTLRPNAFMQNICLQQDGIKAGQFVEPTRDAASSLVDVRDVAAVAVSVAGGDYEGESLNLTGPEALTGSEIAAILSEALGEHVDFVSPSVDAFRAALLDRGGPPWHAEALTEFYTVVQSGKAPHLALVSPLVESITGRRARNLRDFAREIFGRRA